MLSPAYDLTYSSSLNGEHATTINGNGVNPGIDDLLEVAKKAGLDIKAAKAAGCDDFIRALPQGYMTTAGAAGGRLSGGERQRIAIARAMMKNAPIMILDEATASSDPENEASIQTALSDAVRGRTLVVIAHRLSTVMNAEQIAYVKSGRIEAVGTHTELLEKCPDYAKQWALSEG